MISVRQPRSRLRRLTARCVVAGALVPALACGSTSTTEVPPSTGSLVVQISMTGTDVPLTGVTVSVDGSQAIRVASNADYRFAPLTTGEHQVTVAGVAANCTSAEALTRAATIATNTEDSISFGFACSKAALAAHGAIAFARADSTGFFDIWVMNSDGTGATDLTNSANSSDLYGSWPADGAHIVFLMHGESTPEIAIVGRDGSGLTTITNDARQKTSPAVSPDGSRVAFAMADSANHWDIWVVNIDGSNSVRLTADTAVDDHPSWSPDGTRIVFNRFDTPETSSSLVMMNADGSNIHQLSAPGGYDVNASWSPDGSQIAFSRMVDGQAHIAVMRADGTNVEVLTTGADADDTPTWSGDGTRIAFWSGREGTGGIWIMNADGTALERITPLDTYNVFPAWSR